MRRNSALCWKLLGILASFGTCKAFLLSPRRYFSKSFKLRDVAREDLPDYNTPVDIDQIRLDENKWRRKDLFGTSLVDETMKELQTDEEFQETARRMETMGPAKMSKEERTKRRRALDQLGVPAFHTFLAQKIPETNGILRRRIPSVLQINIGLYCNQACGHCHVESSPLRTEHMTAHVAAQCLELLKNTPSITTLDITGGAPELHEHFRFLVKMARELRPDLDIIDRCNLTGTSGKFFIPVSPS